MADKTVYVNVVYKMLASDPATPPSGYITIYPKADGNIYSKNDSGVIKQLTNVAGGSAASVLASTVVQKDLGSAPLFSGTFDIVGSGFAGYVGVRVWVEPTDEYEFDQLTALGKVISDTVIRVYWGSTPGPQSGIKNFYYVLYQ